MKIAMIGQKGIPAKWGGIEYHVGELSTRLAKKGHEVTVYVRDWYTGESLTEHEGVKLIHTPTIRTKHLDAFIHSFTSTMNAIFNNYDVIHFHGTGPSFFCFLPRLFKKRVVFTVHSQPSKSDKWSRLAKSFLNFSEWIGVKCANEVICVSNYLKHYVEKKYGKKAAFIPSGMEIKGRLPADAISKKFGLRNNGYLLFLGRLTPEKRIEVLINAFNELQTDLKLVIAGGSSATDKYVNELHALAKDNNNIIFTDYVDSPEREELYSNAKAFILPSSLEGLPTALLRAMSYGLLCLASGIPAHLEIIEFGINGVLFLEGSADDLKEKLEAAEAISDDEVMRIGNNAKDLVEENYNWDNVVEQVEETYMCLLNTKGRDKPACRQCFTS